MLKSKYTLASHQNMVVQLIFLSIILFFSPLVPPVLSPLAYSLTGALLVQKVDPRLLLLISVWVVTIADILIRFLQNRIIKNISLYKNTSKTDLFSRIFKKMNEYFDSQNKLTKIWLKREKYIETGRGKFFTFVFAVFLFLPVLADIIWCRLLHKKIKFAYFVLAVIIGKTISHGSFIFFGKGLISLLKI